MIINDEVHDRYTFVMFYKHQAEDGNLLHSSRIQRRGTVWTGKMVESEIVNISKV